MASWAEQIARLMWYSTGQRIGPVKFHPVFRSCATGYSDPRILFSWLCRRPSDVRLWVSTSVGVAYLQTLEDVNDWMARNRLCLNPSKTELIWLGSARQLHHCPMGHQSIAGVWITPAVKVRDLELVIDADLSMTSHVDNIIRICPISDNFGLFDVPSRQSQHRHLSEHLCTTVGWTTVTVPWLDCLDMLANDFRRCSDLLHDSVWGYRALLVCRTPCDVIFIGWTFQTESHISSV